LSIDIISAASRTASEPLPNSLDALRSSSGSTPNIATPNSWSLILRRSYIMDGSTRMRDLFRAR
jgi:hypothetical protein